MTRLALGAKLGKPGSPPSRVRAKSRARQETAQRDRAEAARGFGKEMAAGDGERIARSVGFVFIRSTFPNRGVEIQDGLGQLRSWRPDSISVEMRVGLAVADGDQLARAARVL